MTLGSQRSWVFFDVGYTLLDETAAWEDQFRRFAKAINAADESAETARMWHTYRRACVEFAPKQWLAIVQAHAPTPSHVEQLLSLSAGWRHDLETPYPGVHDTLSTLARSYRIGIIANQSAGTRERLRHHGLLDSISLVIGSAEAGVSKPDPAFFVRALREAQVEPCDAWMVGDRLDNDIRPANLLGMRTIHVLQGGSCAQTPRDATDAPTFRVNSVPDILPLL